MAEALRTQRATRLQRGPSQNHLFSDALTIASLDFVIVTPLKWSQLGLPGLPVEPDYIGWTILLWLTARAALNNRHLLDGVWVSLPIAAFLGWISCSLIWSIERGATANELARSLLLTLLASLACVGRKLPDMLRLTAISLLHVLLLSWLLRIVFPDIALADEPAHVGAMRGILMDKNLFGFIAVISLITFTHQWIASRSPRGRRVWLSAMLLAVASVLASTSRTALSVAVIGSLAAGLILIVMTSRRPRLLLGAAANIIAAGFAYTLTTNIDLLLLALDRDPSLTGRTEIWRIVEDAISEAPIFGYGWKSLWIPGSSFTEELWAKHHHIAFFHAHNGYLDLAAQVGLVGLALALAVLLLVIFRSLNAFGQRPSTMSAWPIVFVVTLLIYNTTEVVGFTGIAWMLLTIFSTMLESGHLSRME